MRNSILSLVTLALFASHASAGSYVGGDVRATINIRDTTMVIVGAATVSGSGAKLEGAEVIIGNSVSNSEVRGSVISSVEITDSTLVGVGVSRWVIGNDVR